jgi:hypothetical protein
MAGRWFVFVKHRTERRLNEQDEREINQKLKTATQKKDREAGMIANTCTTNQNQNTKNPKSSVCLRTLAFVLVS